MEITYGNHKSFTLQQPVTHHDPGDEEHRGHHSELADERPHHGVPSVEAGHVEEGDEGRWEVSEGHPLGIDAVPHVYQRCQADEI